MRILGSAFATLVILAACHGGAEVAAPRGGDVDSAVAPRPAPSNVAAGACKPTYTGPANTTCEPRHYPASNASSSYGCTSDADCKGGHEGRCVRNGSQSALPVRRSNLLAGPPPLPLLTVCVADACMATSECPPSSRCECGTGLVRNQCVPLDTCSTDKDCAADTLCQCGEGGVTNRCADGNCRVDADCAAGLPCVEGVARQTAYDWNGPYGRYCGSPKDECHKREDCKPDSGQECAFDLKGRVWRCQTVPPRPPG